MGGYQQALARASDAMARQADADKKRGKENSPGAAMKSVLGPLGGLVDIGLSAAGLPPIAGAIGGAVSGIATAASTGDAGELVGGLSDSTATYRKWEKEEDAKKVAAEREKRKSSQADEFLKLFI